MTLLQERLPDFPENPGDGFQIKESLPDGGFVLWTYSESYNQWTYETFNNAISGYIFTDQVLTRTEATPAPMSVASEDEVPSIRNQKDVNHFLANKLGGGTDDQLVVRVEALEADQERQDSEVLVDQQRQDEDILTLQQEIDALENTRYVGTWSAIDDASKNGRPPGDGNFYFNTGDLPASWNLVGWIYIADVDSNGVTFTHGGIQAGDQIEVISKAENSYGVYTIESVQDAGEYIAIKIETMHRSDGTPATEAHLIKIFSVETGIDLSEADARYMRLRGNQQLDKDVTFRIRQNDLSDNGNTFISINDGEMNLYHVADPEGDAHAANQKYVNEQRDTRLALTGGTLAGQLTIKTAPGTTGGNCLRLEAGEDLAENQNILYVKNQSQAMFWVDSNDVGVKNGYVPTGDYHVAHKKYVDEQIAKIAANPARLSWKWDTTSTGDSAPPAGCFKMTTNSGTNYYRFSFETAEGTKLDDSIIPDFNRTIDNGPVGTIWYRNSVSGNWKLKQQFRINSFRWNFNNHFEMRVTSRNGQTTFTNGSQYFITVGGFF